MMSLCFAIWCLGADARPEVIRLMTTQDVYNNGGVENRVVAVEGHWLIGGYVFQPDNRDAIFAGAVSARLQPHPRLSLEGGAIVGTTALPRRGTRLNWLARVQVRLTGVVAFEFLHISNGGPRDVANPAIDSIGVSFRLR
jgi:hypothetical protein